MQKQQPNGVKEIISTMMDEKARMCVREKRNREREREREQKDNAKWQKGNALGFKR